MKYKVNIIGQTMDIALNESTLALDAGSIEMTGIRMTVFQNLLVLDMITSIQGRTRALLQKECCVYIPDEQSLLNHSVEAIYE